MIIVYLQKCHRLCDNCTEIFIKMVHQNLTTVVIESKTEKNMIINIKIIDIKFEESFLNT